MKISQRQITSRQSWVDWPQDSKEPGELRASALKLKHEHNAPDQSDIVVEIMLVLVAYILLLIILYFYVDFSV